MPKKNETLKTYEVAVTFRGNDGHTYTSQDVTEVEARNRTEAKREAIKLAEGTSDWWDEYGANVPWRSDWFKQVGKTKCTIVSEVHPAQLKLDNRDYYTVEQFKNLFFIVSPDHKICTVDNQPIVFNDRAAAESILEAGYYPTKRDLEKELEGRAA